MDLGRITPVIEDKWNGDLRSLRNIGASIVPVGTIVVNNDRCSLQPL